MHVLRFIAGARRRRLSLPRRASVPERRSGSVRNSYRDGARKVNIEPVRKPVKRCFASRFVATMKRYTLTSVPGLLSTPSSSNSLPLSPPHSILNHPPLARITNAILTALNDLRACAPISIALAVVRRIDSALRSVVASVAEYSR